MYKSKSKNTMKYITLDVKTCFIYLVITNIQWAVSGHPSLFRQNVSPHSVINITNYTKIF